ncbi:hypothetical protein [Rufibacter immobilis]|uniref:hypothetical protein n=1 Tax=Rufibacter immobilis TaxID=1348778 RepID=UPI0035E4ABDB
MGKTEKKAVTLVVYYNSTQPISTLTLDPEDAYLAWLADSLEVIPCGNYYCLRLTNAQDFRQARRIFPLIGHTNRHLRFRGVLRKKAIQRVPAAAAVQQPQETYTLQPAFTPGLAAMSGLRWAWFKSIFQLSLNG